MADPRPALQAAGDEEGLAREARRRQAWAWENALRKHNLVGFTGEILKGVVRGLLRQENGEKAYKQWIEEGTKRTKDRIEREKGRKEAAKGDNGGAES